MGDGTAEFLDTRSSLSSPLAVRLMGVEGVKAIFYGPDFVTVSKDSENPWAVIKPEVYSILMEFFSSGQSLFRSVEDKENAGPQDTRILDTDSETVAMIKELLETRVRPAIMEDGGDIEYRGFEGDIVKVKLKGSCRGCDSSTVTLKTGIERMLMHLFPRSRVLNRFWTWRKKWRWMNLVSSNNVWRRNNQSRCQKCHSTCRYDPLDIK